MNSTFVEITDTDARMLAERHDLEIAAERLSYLGSVYGTDDREYQTTVTYVVNSATGLLNEVGELLEQQAVAPELVLTQDEMNQVEIDRAKLRVLETAIHRGWRVESIYADGATVELEYEGYAREGGMYRAVYSGDGEICLSAEKIED